mgnify:CR=1 FL=1
MAKKIDSRDRHQKKGIEWFFNEVKKAAKDMLLRRGVWLDTGRGEGGDITVANVNKALKEVELLAKQFTKYGVAVEKTHGKDSAYIIYVEAKFIVAGPRLEEL